MKYSSSLKTEVIMATAVSFGIRIYLDELVKKKHICNYHIPLMTWQVCLKMARKWHNYTSIITIRSSKRNHGTQLLITLLSFNKFNFISRAICCRFWFVWRPLKARFLHPKRIPKGEVVSSCVSLLFFYMGPSL